MTIDYFDKYPELKKHFEVMRIERRDEILNYLKNNDEVYSDLIKNRAKQSMILCSKLKEDFYEFEKYMDLVYEQELYELDVIYAHAFYDALSILKNLKILQ